VTVVRDGHLAPELTDRSDRTSGLSTGRTDDPEMGVIDRPKSTDRVDLGADPVVGGFMAAEPSE
jgi:hypothetical protein